MKTAQSVADAAAIPGNLRVLQPDGSWVIYEPGDAIPDGVFGTPDNGIPDEVTMRQARLALHAIGKLDLVEAAIDALPEPPRVSARITWDHSQTVRRSNPMLALLAPTLGLSAADLDALFIAAAAL